METIIVSNSSPTPRISLNGTEIKVVQEYVLLSQTVSFSQRFDKEIQRRINQGCKSSLA